MAKILGNAASIIYGQSAVKGEMHAIPRNKYQFTVSMDTIDGPVVLSRIASLSLPSFAYRNQTINNYNNKSIIQTGIDYSPISLTAYDTKDAVFENFLKKYAKHYFAGPMNDISRIDWVTSEKGFDLKADNHYIRSMKIIRKDTHTLDNVIEIFNPFISSTDTDTLDYSDSSPVIFRVSFDYEGYRILSDIVPEVTADDGYTEVLETKVDPKLQEFADYSNEYPTDVHNIKSNKSAITPVAQLEEPEVTTANTVTTTSHFSGTVQGVWNLDLKEKVARAKEIVAEGNIAGPDVKFQVGINQIVTLPNGDRYVSQVPEKDINVVTGDVPPELEGLI